MWSQIDNTFVDRGNVHIDAWETEDSNEEGKVIAKVSIKTAKVEYIDPRAMTDSYAQEMIEEAVKSVNNGEYDEEE